MQPKNQDDKIGKTKECSRQKRDEKHNIVECDQDQAV